MRASRLRVAALLALAWAAPAGAQGALGSEVAAFETRVDALSDALGRRLDAVPVVGPLAERVRLSGSWIGAWIDSESGSQVGSERWSTWDARLFLDVEVARDVSAGERVLVRNVGVSAEWEIFRLGRRSTDELGNAYLDLQGLLGSPWLNVQLGRFQIPVGEAYLRFGKAVRDNPFLSNPVGGPWWWDEGVRVHGADARGRYGYVASFTNGETRRDLGLDAGDQGTLKLFVRPASWLYLSGSALVSGRTGSDAEPAEAALWLGESWARGFGSGTWVPSFQEGAPVAAGPGRLDGTVYVGADAVLTHPAGARLWLSYGTYEIDSSGPARYDRRLHAWLAELVLEGRLAAPELRAFYLALRANGLGTYDRDEGYLLDIRYAWSTGYNLRSLDAYSLALGWRVSRWVTFKAELALQDVELVHGAGAAIATPTGRADWVGAAVGIHF
jgi:hypothetical protein